MKASAKRKDPYHNHPKKMQPNARQWLQAAFDSYNAGNFPQAAALCQRVLQQEQNQPNAANLLAAALHNVGQTAQAVEMGKQLVAIYPDYGQAHRNLAVFMNALNDREGALKHFHAALENGQDAASTFLELGDLYLKYRKDNERAVYAYGQAILRDPSQTSFWISFWDAYRNIPNVKIEDDVVKALGNALENHLGHTLTISAIARSYLTFHAGLLGVIKRVDEGELDSNAWLEDEAVQSSMQNALFQSFLKSHLVTGELMERIMTISRQAFLRYLVDADKELDKPIAAFLGALALQMELNEYAFYVSEEEQALLKQLKANIKGQSPIEREKRLGQQQLLVYACYSSLKTLEEDEAILQLKKTSGKSDLAQIIQFHILDWNTESALRAEMPSFSEVADDVSKEVREMYEANPYPRWHKEMQRNGRGADIELSQIVPTEYQNAAKAIPSKPSILIAGCGTGRHVHQTYQYLTPSRMLAVDLSKASLAYAQRSAQENKFKHVEFKQGDILELDALDEQFDVVESVGVLHHMADPLAGWKQVTNRLKPGGFMKIALYSELARASVVEARNYIAEKGYAADDVSIRQCRKDILDDKSFPLRGQLLSMKDFYTLSECRDLIFHVQEHRFSVPQLKEAVTSLGLELMGFQFSSSEIKQAYLRYNPSDKYCRDFDKIDAFEKENPQTFKGMYILWLHKPA